MSTPGAFDAYVIDHQEDSERDAAHVSETQKHAVIRERVRVSLDDVGQYDAEIIANKRWNGWVIPRFTREVAARVMADVAAANSEVCLSDREVLRWEGNAIVSVIAPGTPQEEISERYEPDADGRYAIGAYSWCWSLDGEQGPTKQPTDHAVEMLAFVAQIARMTQDGEEIAGRDFVMENDDAVGTLNQLIDSARVLVAEATGRAA